MCSMAQLVTFLSFRSIVLRMAVVSAYEERSYPVEVRVKIVNCAFKKQKYLENATPMYGIIVKIYDWCLSETDKPYFSSFIPSRSRL